MRRCKLPAGLLWLAALIIMAVAFAGMLAWHEPAQPDGWCVHDWQDMARDMCNVP
jgi:hypothetical protein